MFVFTICYLWVYVCKFSNDLEYVTKLIKYENKFNILPPSLILSPIVPTVPIILPTYLSPTNYSCFYVNLSSLYNVTNYRIRLHVSIVKKDEK